MTRMLQETLFKAQRRRYAVNFNGKIEKHHQRDVKRLQRRRYLTFPLCCHLVFGSVFFLSVYLD